MAAIITDQFRRNSASSVLADIVGGDNTYYVGIGKTDPWPENEGLTENSPNFSAPQPVGSLSEMKEVRNNLISLLKVDATKSRIIIPNVAWKIGNKHKPYAANDITCFVPTTVGAVTTYPCYAIADSKIWLCLLSSDVGLNNIPSSQPLYVKYSASTGYTWIAIANIEAIVEPPFNTDQFIAVKLDSTLYDDGNPLTTSPGETANNATKGHVYGFTIANGGTGYTSDSTAVLVGDGTNDPIPLTITRTADVITGAAFTNANTTAGFNNASVRFTNTGGGSGAVIIPNIAPIEGFGPTILNNLPTWFLGLAANFDGKLFDGGIADIDSDAQLLSYRQISIIKNPTIEPTAPDESVSADALKYLTITGSITNINANTGDIITQTGSGITAKAFFDSYVYNSSTGTGRLYYHQNDSAEVNYAKFSNTGSIYVGTNMIDEYAYNLVTDSEYIHNSGEVLFIENRRPITRNENQKEEIKLVIQF
jgi:hypothetical protein